MTEGSPPAPRTSLAILVEKLAGVLVTAGLMVTGLFGLGVLDIWIARRDDMFLKTIPDVLVSWRDPSPLAFWAFILTLAVPALVVPGAFGLDARNVPPALARRARLVAIGASAAAVVGGIAVAGLAARPELGVATPFGAAWLIDGKAREHWSWGAATSVGVGCATTPSEITGAAPTHALNYDVTFPSAAEARLARDTTDLRAWLGKMTPIDSSLRAREVPRFAAADAACMAHFEKDLAEPDKARLRTLIGL
ncbi:hypothetical protein [Caulobacter sp. RHG1]|uniref:hypothetical protein n=1 Tax=Caulobacter sp. (strain RHG1) TaxID=2545762 RepID=UPI001554392B|nr:hypothetical protein [Caulobacter sp. RHG1]NQE63972.1 hypothetical protein [Caulobacter sp. RHG1]